jgi:serine/threonine-protein kinase
LAYHDALAAHPELAAHGCKARVGIYFAEVVLRQNSSDDVLKGAKPTDAYGLAVPVVARISSLGIGGQTLMGRLAFDMARRACVGSDAIGADVEWCSHGRYAFQGISEPMEIFEVGRRGIAPLKPPSDTGKARRAGTEEEAVLNGWRPAAEQVIPHRDNWVLVGKLGQGGFGEVWLAEHRKSRERRAFKFCFDLEKVRSLKREVTLFRLLKDQLGDREDIARVIEWNFERPPFFVECQYTEGGNLKDWSDAREGIGQIPLGVRLELVAQVATALAAAHSAGVLHKDIKPANVLIYTDPQGEPRIRLTDFGIGELTERDRLAKAGLTATGLTSAAEEHDGSSSLSGTQLYMAPELFSGGKATIQADIYALGVTLFQAVVGDFRKPLTSDWREEVPNEFLREDIALCVAGDPERRFGNAKELANRLRSLSERKAIAEEDRRRRDAVSALQRRQARLKQRFVWAVVGVVVLFVFLTQTVMALKKVSHEKEAAQQATQEKDEALMQLQHHLEELQKAKDEAAQANARLASHRRSAEGEIRRLERRAEEAVARLRLALDERNHVERYTLELIDKLGSQTPGDQRAAFVLGCLEELDSMFLQRADSDASLDERYARAILRLLLVEVAEAHDLTDFCRQQLTAAEAEATYLSFGIVPRPEFEHLRARVREVQDRLFPP